MALRPSRDSHPGAGCQNMGAINSKLERLLTMRRMTMKWFDVDKEGLAKIQQRVPKATFEVMLPTEIPDEEGRFQRTRRKTKAAVYEPLGDETPHIYEMGKPVAETYEWHIDVQQKVPLCAERKDVDRTYARQLRTAVANRMLEQVTEEDVEEPWVMKAIRFYDIERRVLEDVVKKRFGEKAVLQDPSDRKANHRAALYGYEVVSDETVPHSAWNTLETSGTMRRAGYEINYRKNCDVFKMAQSNEYPRDRWTPAMERVVEFTSIAAERLLGTSIAVRVLRLTSNAFDGYYGKEPKPYFHFNMERLGKKWFEPENRANILDLIIHEFGHHYSGDHLSKKYYKAVTDLGARMTEWALEEPEAFDLLDPVAPAKGQNDDGPEELLDAAS